jgi:hypothetical protein
MRQQMLKSEEFSKQKELEGFEPKQKDYQILAIPEKSMEAIEMFGNLEIVFKSKSEVRQHLLSIIDLLSVRDESKLMLSVAYKHLVRTNEAYREYMEMFLASSTFKKE